VTYPIPGQTQRSRARHVSADLPHHLYRCYDADGVLLYIGCTSDVEKRMASHRRGNGIGPSRWLAAHMARYEVDADRYPNRYAGQDAEAAAIFTEQPVFNTQGRCLPINFTRAQIEDYLAGRPIRQWPEVINPSRAIADYLKRQERAA
jgi:hypothetical protein